LLADVAPPSALVLASSILLALTALGPALALGRAGGRVARAPPRATMAEGLAILKGDVYVRSLAVLVLVSTVALTLGDYVFKSAVARSVPAQELGTFFGGVYAFSTSSPSWPRSSSEAGCSGPSGCTVRCKCFPPSCS
jgi:ATP/ADP translocase